MICKIVKDVGFLKQKSIPCTKKDLGIAKDLQDTLQTDSEKPAPLGVGWIALDIFMCMKELNLYTH